MRALPVHPLGIVDEPSWADGTLCSPRDFYFHDLDHARYKVREDLLALGYPCPDVSDAEPVILPYAASRIAEAGPKLWQLAPQRLRLAAELLTRIDGIVDRDLRHAADWLLFEMVHEKSLPMDRNILRRELEHSRHVAKLQAKLHNGFYPEAEPRVFARLADARQWLLGVL